MKNDDNIDCDDNLSNNVKWWKSWWSFGPLVLWPEWAVDRRQRERDGGFKYFDNDHVHADDLVDDDEDYCHDNDQVRADDPVVDDEDYFSDDDHLVTDEICQMIYMLTVFKMPFLQKKALRPQNDNSEE